MYIFIENVNIIDILFDWGYTMKKSEVIFDYIMGNDIKNFDVEDLENDWQFMKAVIECSNDKKMYHFCSDSVKNNYEFIKFLVSKFYYDLDFIIPIVEDFLLIHKNDEDNLESFELAILLSNLPVKDERLENYKALANVFYTAHEIQVNYTLSLSDNEKFKYEVGKGFLISKFKYSQSKIITDYIAKKNVEKIFYLTDNSLEELLHKNFENVDSITNINSFLINHLLMIDKYLGNYISANVNLLNDIKKEIVKIKNNWNFYIQSINDDKVDIFLKELSDYANKFDLNMFYSIAHLANYVIKELSLDNIFKNNENYQCLRKMAVEMYEDENLEIDKNDFEGTFLIGINYILNFARNLFKNNYLDRTPDDYESNIINIKEFKKNK